jgi:hypothetical protein
MSVDLGSRRQWERTMGELPEDMAELAGSVALTHAVLDAVSRVRMTAGTWGLPGGLSARVPLLMTLYGYALARGWYPSEELLERMSTDSCLRYLSRGVTLDAALLRSFRRRHVTELRQVLTLVLGNTALADRRLRSAVEADSLALEG